MSDEDSKKIYEYHLVDATKAGEIIAKIWWSGKSIQSDSKRIMKTLKSIAINGKTYRDGLDFFNSLPLYYKSSGYTRLKRIS